MTDQRKKATPRNFNEVPEYVKNLDPRDIKGLEGLDPEDSVWGGDNGEVDSHSFGDDKWEPLEILVRAIIAAHPGNGEESVHDRISNAIAALEGMPKKAGNREKLDYEFLLEVAWKYHVIRYNEGKYPKLMPIIKDLFERFPGLVEYDGTRENALKRLARKFETNKDLLLSRATTHDDWDRSIRMGSLWKLIEKLNRSGIPANPDVVPFRRLSRFRQSKKRDATPTD